MIEPSPAGTSSEIQQKIEPLLLEVDDLQTHFFMRNSTVRAVDGISFSLAKGETLAIVGESGSGKSVTALSILRLIPSPPGRFVGGSIRFLGTDILKLKMAKLRGIRGNEISMIFQDPMTSLNPVLTIGRQIGEAIMLHQGTTHRVALKRAAEMLDSVRIADAKRRLAEYPHQLSGGMRQRVMIAMALACSPKLLIADEPTTALDVTVQAQILDLLRELKRKSAAAIIVITHDLGVVAELAQRVIVMYAGKKVEEAGVRELLRRPRHPYTLGLLQSLPKLGTPWAGSRPARLSVIPGMVPALDRKMTGCAFASRCAYVTDRCRTEPPPMVTVASGHMAACFHSDRVAAP